MGVHPHKWEHGRTVADQSAKQSREGDPMLLHRLRCIASRSLRDWSPPDREDLIQDAALKLLRRGRSLEGGVLSGCYLSRTLRSVAIDEVRRRSRRHEVACEDLEPHDPERVVWPSPEQALRTARLGRRVEHALTQVHSRRRDLVERYVTGSTVRECAAELSVEHKRAENLIYRGLGQLRRALEGAGGEG